jgi:hypothetical protein
VDDSGGAKLRWASATPIEADAEALGQFIPELEVSEDGRLLPGLDQDGSGRQ